MGYGGIVNKIIDPFGIGAVDAPKTPKPGKVGQDYLGLINAYAQGTPTILQTEQTYRPQFTQLDLDQLQSVIPTFSNILRSASPDASAIVRGINPGQTELLDSLTRSATAQLNAGADLDPALERIFTQSVRGGQAARGLGYGPADVLEESTALTGLGNTLRREREGFAGTVAGLNNQFETAPALELLTSIPTFSEAISRGSGPTIMPGAQTYDAFNTAYNARAAASIAGANNAAAIDSSY